MRVFPAELNVFLHVFKYRFIYSKNSVTVFARYDKICYILFSELRTKMVCWVTYTRSVN